jgi:hypothetical protein
MCDVIYAKFRELIQLLVRFQVLTVASMKVTVFWDVAPCSLLEVYRRFKGASWSRFFPLTLSSLHVFDNSFNFESHISLPPPRIFLILHLPILIVFHRLLPWFCLFTHPHGQAAICPSSTGSPALTRSPPSARATYRRLPCLKPLNRGRLTYRPDDGGSKHLWNVGKLIPVYKAQHPGRQPSSYTPPWQPQAIQKNMLLLI